MENSTPDSNNQERGSQITSSAPMWIVHPVHCPACGKGQTVSENCTDCGSNFSSSVNDASDVSPVNELQAGGIPPAKTGTYSLPSPMGVCSAVLGKLTQRVRIFALSLLIVSIVSLSAGVVKYRSDSQLQYLRNYVLALYGIRSGIEMTSRISAGNYKAWREGVSSSPIESGAVDARTLGDLRSVKAEIDGIMVKVGNPPEKFNQAARRLENLYSIYDRANTLIIRSSGSLSLHRSENDAARKEFYREIENLKAEMPAPLADEFRKAGKKYDLRFLGLEQRH